jgi:hypothetical protein
MRKAHLGSFLSATLVLSLVACGPSSNDGDDDDDSPGKKDGGSGFIDARNIEFPPDGGGDLKGCDKIDILFVVDNSGSMGDKQMNLATNFPMFASLIENYVTASGKQLDYHIGITTTDKEWTETIFGFPNVIAGNDGKLVTGASCNFPAGRRYLQRGDNVGTVLPCVANVGTSGNANEMPLEGARLALTKRIQDGTNAGFLRPEALLAVVFLTDEEDCSTTQDQFTSVVSCDGPFAIMKTPVAEYLAAIDAAKGGQRALWAAAAIAGPTPSGCDDSMGNGGSADPATRLSEFISSAGSNGVFAPICEADLASALKKAFDTFSVACENVPTPD